MAKLTFRYGTTGAGKTLDLLKVNYNYKENGMNTLIFTSMIDDRYGNDIVKSRTGVHEEAIGICEMDDIYFIVESKIKKLEKIINCILVDEIQFFTKEHVIQLAKIVDKLNIPVICYGLRSDFKTNIFDSISTLMVYADEIEEIKTICSCCGKKKATFTAKIKNGIIITEGDQVEIGGNEKYKPFCRKCYNAKIEKQNFDI
jgi:thymidine kinase